MNSSTPNLHALAFDCCLVIHWSADHPDCILRDLPRPHAERLLEDMVATLRPHVRELFVKEQLVDGQIGQVLRSWSISTCAPPPTPEGAPGHSPTWFEATAKTFNPPTNKDVTP